MIINQLEDMAKNEKPTSAAYSISRTLLFLINNNILNELASGHEFAELAHVSQASVYKFARKFNYQGWRDFYHQLIKEVEEQND